MLAAGQDADGANVVIGYDPATGAEDSLINAGHEIGLYHLKPVDDTTAMFDGLWFSDNSVDTWPAPGVCGTLVVGPGCLDGGVRLPVTGGTRFVGRHVVEALWRQATT